MGLFLNPSDRMSIRCSGFILILPSTATPFFKVPPLISRSFSSACVLGFVLDSGVSSYPPNSPWAHVSEVNLGVAIPSPADIQFNELPGGLLLRACQRVGTHTARLPGRALGRGDPGAPSGLPFPWRDRSEDVAVPAKGLC